MLALKFILKTVEYNKKKYICNLMDSNPCGIRCILKKLGIKKTRTKVVHKNVSQGYIKAKRHIMKNSQLSYVSIQPNFEKIIC